MKKFKHLILGRAFITVLLMLLQLTLLIAVLWKFNTYFVYFYSGSLIISALVLLHIISSRSNPASKLAWIIPVLLLPIFGSTFYLMFGRTHMQNWQREKLSAISKKSQTSMAHDSKLHEIESKNPNVANQSRYIQDFAFAPPFGNTATEYLPMGEIAFERMKEQLETAERYIFMEYFIIEEGVMWNELLEILCRKAAQGVDVRIIYDDVGCLFTLPYQYDKILESMGIQCSVFNPFQPVLSSKFNFRSHRKITVIDGRTGFTGGINLADEYINAIKKYGHWKDSAIMLKGDAVWGLTTMFLSMWDYLREETQDYDAYRPKKMPPLDGPTNGYVQPYSDMPIDNEPVGETIYLNLINKAQRYVYITTPYLVTGNELMTALSAAAKSGVDVRIITPHIADKWYVFSVTQSSYAPLIESGVKIFEYTPGFIHAKTFVVDDILGTVGTVNMDYRSFNLHFECGVWLYDTDSLRDIRDDFMLTLNTCHQVSLEECLSISWSRKLARTILKVFAPLM